MKDKNSGFTLIEILVAIAIMGILIAMISPILQVTNRSNEKEKIINQIDSSLAKSVELIKRTARMAKKTGNTIETMGISVSKERDSITMNVPVEDAGGNINSETVTFKYNIAAKNITVRSGAGEEDEIAQNVTDARFEKVEIEVEKPDKSKPNPIIEQWETDIPNGTIINEGILRIYIQIDLNKTGENEAWKKKEIRDAAVTRLDVE